VSVPVELFWLEITGSGGRVLSILGTGIVRAVIDPFCAAVPAAAAGIRSGGGE